MNRTRSDAKRGIAARTALLLLLSLLLIASASAIPPKPSTDTDAKATPPELPWSTDVPLLVNQLSSLAHEPSRILQDLQPPDSLPSHATVLLIRGDYENEAGQEPVAIWQAVFEKLGFSTSTAHIASLPQTVNANLLVVLPSVGSHVSSFGVTTVQAQVIMNTGLPVLLLGYAHEVLDRLWGFNPVADFIPCVERYLWTSNPSLQIFTAPHQIPKMGEQLYVYTDHVTSDAYRLSSLPREVSVLGSNLEASGAQLLWFRALSNNSALYYWSVDQAVHLSEDGLHLLENLVHWLLRAPLAERLSSAIAAWQLALPSDGGYWATQGAGGFGYPLEPSITFTYYVTDLVQTSTLEVDTSSFGDWLLNDCYKAAEGCFEDLASPQLNDRCVTTAMATLVLAALNRLAELDADRVGSYLAGCQDSVTGGFLAQQGSTRTSLKATRFAIYALAALGQLSRISIAGVRTYIASCQELNPQSPEFGGFYASPGGNPASLVASLDAIQTLSLLEALASVNQTALLSFIASCEDSPSSGLFDTKVTYDTDEFVMGTGCALRLLDLLNALGDFNIQASRIFLLASQFANGGWGRGDTAHDFHNSADEAWYAVQGLTPTGGLGSSRNGLTTYLAGCGTGWGGATEPWCFGDLLTSWRLVSALHRINRLSAINQSAFASYLANCWVIARSSVGSHQLPPSVGMDTDLATPDRCVIETGTFGPLYHYAYSQLVQMLGLNGSLWSTRGTEIRTEIEASQTFAAAYRGMFGFHHLYVGHESDLTFRFDTTCWNLLAYGELGGSPSELLNATAALEYLRTCLQDNGTHQYFSDVQHQAQLPLEWRAAGGSLASTWLGLQAWAYLDPSMTGLDGHRLASYAATYLTGAPSLVSAFYAVDTLQLLAELGLDPDALKLIDADAIAALLVDAVAYDGLVQDSTLPTGRWIPYTTSLAVQLAVDLDLLPYLDLNPVLRLSLLAYPLGNYSCGETTAVMVTVEETRWHVLPADLSISAALFNSTFTGFIGPDVLQRWNCTVPVPYRAMALGPQDLKVVAGARGCLPNRIELAQVCWVWGNLSTAPTYTPGLVVPRSVPLNVTLDVTIEGGTGPEADIANALVLLTNMNTSSSYSGYYRGGGAYALVMPTASLAPGCYRLRLEATAPYAAGQTLVEFVTITVRNTSFVWFAATPTSPIAREALTFHVCLEDENSTPIIGGDVSFRITKPGQSQPWLLLDNVTNATGIASSRWTPTIAGQWSISCDFRGVNQYKACSAETSLLIARRPSRCTAVLTSPPRTFIGNQSFLLVTVVDGLNGSALAGRAVSFYEGAQLLLTVLTNASGSAMCSWTAVPPLGTRHFRVEVALTPLHDGWGSSDLSVTVRSTTSVTLIGCTLQLYLGETGRIEVSVAAQSFEAPNGTASVYWDGIWQLDFIVLNGTGRTQFIVAYSDVPGQHLLAILFGHLDAPDVYAGSSVSAVVMVLPVMVPTLSITVSPAVLLDFQPAATISVDAILTYTNGTLIFGLSANVTLQLVTAEDLLVIQIVLHTNGAGEAHWSLSMPQPGFYRFRVQFDGARGFAPATAMTALTIRLPPGFILGQSLPLTLASFAVMVVGLLIGTVVLLRLQKRANRVTRLLLGGRPAHSGTPALTPNEFGFEISPHETQPAVGEELPDDRGGDMR